MCGEEKFVFKIKTHRWRSIISDGVSCGFFVFAYIWSILSGHVLGDNLDHFVLRNSVCDVLASNNFDHFTDCSINEKRKSDFINNCKNTSTFRGICENDDPHLSKVPVVPTFNEKKQHTDRSHLTHHSCKNKSNKIQNNYIGIALKPEIIDQTEAHYLGPMDKVCRHCRAIFFQNESLKCCSNGMLVPVLFPKLIQFEKVSPLIKKLFNHQHK